MHVFFSAGEPSGDLHAARLMAELRRRVPGIRCSGFGGPQMDAAGCELLYPLTNLAVMGLFDFIPLVWRFVSLLWRAGDWMNRCRPDLVVLVDFPGFNWWIARLAKRRGIPVYYFCPPQLWAWGSWRIHKMRRLVDRVLCCLPFELAWYRDHGMATELVGHPFFDEAAERPLDAAFLAQHADGATQIVGILPGSRNHEVSLNFPVQLAVMREISLRHPGVRYLVACYREEHRTQCERAFRESGLDASVEFHTGRTAEVISLADMCLMVSGSVSLELLARHTPAVVIYRVGLFHRSIGRLLIRCKYITLTNLIADKPLMPEFVITGSIAEPVGRIVAILSEWLSDAAKRSAAVDELRQLSAQVAAPGATRLCADAILGGLGEPRNSPAWPRHAA